MPEEIRNIKVLKNVNELENYNEEKKDKKRMEIPSMKERVEGFADSEADGGHKKKKKDRNSGYKKKPRKNERKKELNKRK